MCSFPSMFQTLFFTSCIHILSFILKTTHFFVCLKTDGEGFRISPKVMYLVKSCRWDGNPRMLKFAFFVICLFVSIIQCPYSTVYCLCIPTVDSSWLPPGTGYMQTDWRHALIDLAPMSCFSPLCLPLQTLRAFCGLGYGTHGRC